MTGRCVYRDRLAKPGSANIGTSQTVSKRRSGRCACDWNGAVAIWLARRSQAERAALNQDDEAEHDEDEREQDVLPALQHLCNWPMPARRRIPPAAVG